MISHLHSLSSILEELREPPYRGKIYENCREKSTIIFRYAQWRKITANGR
jgi:hypothetical protein